jgi:hypothetical protein
MRDRKHEVRPPVSWDRFAYQFVLGVQQWEQKHAAKVRATATAVKRRRVRGGCIVLMPDAFKKRPDQRAEEHQVA